MISFGKDLIYTVNSEKESCRNKWKDHIDRAADFRVPKVISSYKPRAAEDTWASKGKDGLIIYSKGGPNQKWLDLGVEYNDDDIPSFFGYSIREVFLLN